MEWMLLRPKHDPTDQGSAPSGRTPGAVACVSSLRRKRGRPTTVTNAQAVGAGSTADVQPVRQRPGKRRYQVHRPQDRRKCFSIHPPPRQAVIIPRGWSLPPHQSQAWRLMHLQRSLLEPGAPSDCKVCPLLRRDGYGTPCRIVSSQHR